MPSLIFTCSNKIDVEDEGTFAGIAIETGPMPNMPFILSEKSFENSIGKKVPFKIDHGEARDIIGSVQFSHIDGKKVHIKGQFNLSRDKINNQFLVPEAAKFFALKKQGDIEQLSTAFYFSKEDVIKKTIKGKKFLEITNVEAKEVSITESGKYGDRAKILTLLNDKGQKISDVFDEFEDKSGIEKINNALKKAIKE